LSALSTSLLLGVNSSSAALNQVSSTADFSQAELMLRLFDQAAAGIVSPAMIDSLLSARGTELVIGQQNISRMVNTDQYRRLLESLPGSGPMPALSAAGSGVRAQRGLDGLQKDIWPELRWAIEHRDVLARRVAELRGKDLGSSALGRAREFLPDSV